MPVAWRVMVRRVPELITVVKSPGIKDPEAYVHHRDLCVGYHVESTPHSQKRSEMGMPILTIVSLPTCCQHVVNRVLFISGGSIQGTPRMSFSQVTEEFSCQSICFTNVTVTSGNTESKSSGSVLFEPGFFYCVSRDIDISHRL